MKDLKAMGGLRLLGNSAMGVLLLAGAQQATAQFVFVPGPASGYVAPASAPPISTLNELGVAAATQQAGGIRNAAQWSQANSPGVALPSTGFTDAFANMIGESGAVVGYGQTGSIYGALRWDGLGSATVLNALTPRASDGAIDARALAINPAGFAVGFSQLYDAELLLGTRPLRWAPGSATPTVLPLASEDNGYGVAQAKLISNSGIIAGDGELFVDGAAVGQRGIRWTNNGTIAASLSGINTDANGIGFSEVKDVNDDGTIVGNSRKYSGATNLGLRAVRWDAGSTVPVELGILGTTPAGVNIDTTAVAMDINGNIAGLSQKYVGGVAKGTRPVVWLAGTTVPLELDVLGTDATGATRGNMSAMNDNGFIAGTIQTFDQAGLALGRKAVVWDLEGDIYNLNDYLAVNSGWTLTVATDITNSGWVMGYGTFDPDGAGGVASYDRYFSMHVDAFAVPEPSAAVFLCAAATLVFSRRTRAGKSLVLT